MSFEAEFLELMTSKITHKEVTGTDLYGDNPTYGTTTANIPAHIEYSSKINRSAETDDITVTVTVYIPPPAFSVGTVIVPRINDNDRILLPADNASHRVSTSDLVYDEDGTPHHQKIILRG